MSALWRIFIVVPLAVALCAQTPAVKPQAHAGDEAAIKKAVHDYMNARDRQDAGALAKLFTADADQLVSSGEWRKGRSEVVQGTLASTRNSGGKRTLTITSIRFIAPDIAIADGPYELAELTGGQNRRMWTSFVLVRSGGDWRISAIRNMLPAPPVPVK